jgi:hypothetical protein
LEIASANSFFFDGVSSVNESVRVVDSFLNRHNYKLGKQNPEIPAAYIVSPQYNTTSPIFITLHDTFLILSVGQKSIYSTASAFNEVFQYYYPQFFAQLLAAIVLPQLLSLP